MESTTCFICMIEVEEHSYDIHLLRCCRNYVHVECHNQFIQSGWNSRGLCRTRLPGTENQEDPPFNDTPGEQLFIYHLCSFLGRTTWWSFLRRNVFYLRKLIRFSFLDLCPDDNENFEEDSEEDVTFDETFDGTYDLKKNNLFCLCLLYSLFYSN